MYINETDQISGSEHLLQTESFAGVMDEETIVASQQGVIRALREAYARQKRDCQGIRVLRRLTRGRKDIIGEYARLRRNLENARRSGSSQRIARARCEMSRFDWERHGSEGFRQRYDQLMVRLTNVQDRLERDQWWYRRWRCANWPSGVRQPSRVKQVCAQRARRIRRLQRQVRDLQRQRRALENRTHQRFWPR